MNPLEALREIVQLAGDTPENRKDLTINGYWRRLAAIHRLATAALAESAAVPRMPDQPPHRSRVAALQAEIGRLQAELHFLVLGDPRVSVNVGVPLENALLGDKL
jgi:hypothetical protein